MRLNIDYPILMALVLVKLKMMKVVVHILLKYAWEGG